MWISLHGWWDYTQIETIFQTCFLFVFIFISCVNSYALGSNLMSNWHRRKPSVTNLSYSQLAAALPFLKTRYLFIFRSRIRYVGHVGTIMSYLYSLGNQTAAHEWRSECNFKSMLSPLFKAMYNLPVCDPEQGSHAKYIALYCVTGRIFEYQCWGLF